MIAMHSETTVQAHLNKPSPTGAAGILELPETVQHKTFPESLQRRRIQESCRSRQSGKCFHLQQQVNLFRIFAAAENFWHKLLTLLLPRQAAAVLLRKLLNYSSAEALTGSGREKREKEISEFIDSGLPVASYTMRSKCSSSFRAPGNLNPAPLNHWSWRLRKNIGLWRFRETWLRRLKGIQERF